MTRGLKITLVMLAALVLSPILLTVTLSRLPGNLRFPVGQVETAHSLFPRLRSVHSGLEQIFDLNLADGYSLLYANIFFFDIIVLFVIIAFCLSLISRSLARLNDRPIDKNESANSDRRPTESSKQAFLSLAVFLAFSVLLQFFFSGFYYPSPSISAERVLGSQYSLIATNLVLFNISLTFFVIFTFFQIFKKAYKL